jgi:hypothetical protein
MKCTFSNRYHFCCNAPRHPDEAGLRRPVGDLARDPELGADRRDQHCPPVAGRRELFERSLDDVEGAVQVCLEIEAPVVLGEPLGAMNRVDHARVGDDRVAAAEGRDRTRNPLAYGGSIPHVELGAGRREGRR